MLAIFSISLNAPHWLGLLEAPESRARDNDDLGFRCLGILGATLRSERGLGFQHAVNEIHVFFSSLSN